MSKKWRRVFDKYVISDKKKLTETKARQAAYVLLGGSPYSLDPDQICRLIAIVEAAADMCHDREANIRNLGV